MPITATRRDLLKGTGALIVGFALAPEGRIPMAAAQQSTAGAPPFFPGGKTVAPDQVDGFLAIGSDGRVTVFSGKVDLGTGVETALTQIVADELDVPLDRIAIVQGDTALTPDQGPTYGSLSIQVGGVQIRQAAATARGMLLDLASQKLAVQPADLVAEDGVVKPKGGGGQGVGYGDLIGGKTFQIKVDKEITTKDPGAFRTVGKPVRRIDIPDK
jgi:nicotinate dehydrogenase subunit B